MYEVLTPIADAVTRTAQPRYNHPFKFYLVHEQQPNAFATPGGNVYVTDALLYFVKNNEQLAGTLCHEVSHTIHHDSMKLLEKDQKLEKRALGAAILLGPSTAHLLAIALIGKLHSLSYSREAESAADLRDRISARRAAITRGGWCGCLRTSQRLRMYPCRSCSRIIPITRIESRR